jgi:hypothetical protein
MVSLSSPTEACMHSNGRKFTSQITNLLLQQVYVDKSLSSHYREESSLQMRESFGAIERMFPRAFEWKIRWGN